MCNWKPDTTEEVLSTACEIYDAYPKHVLALAISKMLNQRLVHPDLVKINLDQASYYKELKKVNQKTTNAQHKQDIKP